MLVSSFDCRVVATQLGMLHNGAMDGALRGAGSPVTSCHSRPQPCCTTKEDITVVHYHNLFLYSPFNNSQQCLAQKNVPNIHELEYILDNFNCKQKASNFIFISVICSFIKFPLEIVFASWIHFFDVYRKLKPAAAWLEITIYDKENILGQIFYQGILPTTVSAIQIRTSFSFHSDPWQLYPGDPDCGLRHVGDPRVGPVHVKEDSVPSLESAWWTKGALTAEILNERIG